MYVRIKEYAKIVGKDESSVRHAILKGDLKYKLDKNGRKVISNQTKWPYSQESRWHGLSKHPLRNTWSGMNRRCYDETCNVYKYYGGKGIGVCDEWRDHLDVFIAWALENGYKPGLTIDRIDHNKGYEPSNCRWVTRSENSRHAAEDTRTERREKRKKWLAYIIERESRQDWFVVNDDLAEYYLNTYAKDRRKREMTKWFLTGFTLRYLNDSWYAMFSIIDDINKDCRRIPTPNREYIETYLTELFLEKDLRD